MKMRCAIYTRVSTDNQAEVEFNSCEAQELKIRSFIKSQENMEIFKVYSDPGFSGASLDRPALREMLNDIKESKINLVISYKIDRLTRSPKDFYQLIELFDKHEVDFLSVTERFDTSTPSGRLLRNIMLTFAQFERELTSERTKDKMIQRAQKGMWNGGTVPFGYKTENKKLTLNEKEAKIIKNIYESYVSSGSLFRVYNELRSKGLISRNGLPFSKTNIYNILRNIIYTGKISYAEVICQGIHKPIISVDLFNLAQDIHKRKTLTNKTHKNFSFEGLLRCKGCNVYMTLSYTNKHKNRKVKRYYYYRCTKTLNRDWNDCRINQVSANRLENYIFENLERISLDKHYIDSLIFKLDNSHSDGQREFEPSSESSKISSDRFQNALKFFVKGLGERKGLDKNLWTKKFIKKIDYSKEEIAITFYYKVDCEKDEESVFGSGCPHSAAAKNGGVAQDKKIPYISRDIGDDITWLPKPEPTQTMDIILPNMIHGCKKKNLATRR